MMNLKKRRGSDRSWLTLALVRKWLVAFLICSLECQSFADFQHRQVAEPVVQAEQSSTKSKLRLGDHQLL